MNQPGMFRGYENLIELNCKVAGYLYVCVYIWKYVAVLNWSMRIKSEKSIWGIMQELGHRKLIKVLYTILEKLSSSCR